MEVLTAEQISLADKKAIEELKIPSIVLMENAARSVFDVFKHLNINKKQNCCCSWKREQRWRWNNTYKVSVGLRI